MPHFFEQFGGHRAHLLRYRTAVLSMQHSKSLIRCFYRGAASPPSAMIVDLGSASAQRRSSL
jgi:hypothetical protein